MQALVTASHLLLAGHVSVWPHAPALQASVVQLRPSSQLVAKPGDAVSGLYIANFDQTDGNGVMPYPFVVRNDASHSDIVVQTDDETWQAYNMWGGQNLYQGNGPAPDGRAYQVSYNRPLDVGGGTAVERPKESKRKTPNFVAFYGEERLFGGHADAKRGTDLPHCVFKCGCAALAASEAR